MTEIMRRDTQAVVDGPAQHFTGRVTIRGQFSRDEPSRVTGAIVTFEPDARTAWHSHPLGQTLIVRGCGMDPGRGWPDPEFSAGDILLCPRNRRHWHGATSEASMSHFAIQEVFDGTNVTWMEKVTDEEYMGGPSR